MADDTAKDALIRRRVLWSTFSNYVGKIITLGAGFLLTPYILRQLGAASFGLWVLISAIAGYGALLDFGIGGAVVKYVAEYRARNESAYARSLIATALCLYAGLGLGALALSLAAAPFLPHLLNVPAEERDTTARLIVLMGIGLAISLPCATPMAVLRGLQRFDLANLISIIGTLLSVVGTVAVLSLGGGLLGLVALNIPLTLAMQAPTLWLIRRVAPDLRFELRSMSHAFVRTVVSYSSSLFAINVAGRLQAQTDEIVIGAFMPISAVTPYALARRLSEIAQILTDQFMKVLLPLASELHAENDRERLRALYIVSTRLTLAIFLPVGCTVVILAAPILTAWVGPEYAAYAYLVAILTFASLVVTSQWPAGSILQGIGRHSLLAVTSLGSGLANLALSIVLVGRYGLTGVAIGTLMPTLVECLGLVLPYTMRVLGVRLNILLKEIVTPALLPALPMSITLYVLRQVLVPASFLSLIVCAGAGWLIYLAGYLSVGASAAERRTYRDFALNMLYVLRAHVNRSHR